MRKKKNPIRKQEKDIARHFTEENIQMVNEKIFNIVSHQKNVKPQ